MASGSTYVKPRPGVSVPPMTPVSAAPRRDRMEPLGFEIVTGTPERMVDMLRADAARWAPVVKATGVKIE